MLNINVINEECSRNIRNSFSAVSKKFVMPSDFLTKDEGVMKGYNTYDRGSSIYSSVFGYSEKIDKLICVNPIKSRIE
ncbi:hypothetical protein HZS_4875 [Henneguya salminicola]|nr:hypothetical protein HZS_4875 [Henneguya salminicola]